MIKTRPFRKSGFRMDEFVGAARDHLRGGHPLPVLKVNSTFPKGTVSEAEVWFDHPLLTGIAHEPQVFKRDMNSALTYGYIGRTRGGRNGIVDVTERDGNVAEHVSGFLGSRAGREFMGKYGLNPSNLSGVKIVVHRKSGRRVVGVWDRASNRFIFFGEASYKR